MPTKETTEVTCILCKSGEGAGGWFEGAHIQDLLLNLIKMPN